MRPHFYRLLICSLLSGAIGTSCSSKPDPQPQAQPQAVSSASYTLDGQPRTCTVAQGTTTAQGYDFLTITLTTAPQPSIGPEVLVLNLRRPAGQANAAYEYMPVGSLLINTSASLSPYEFFHTSPLPTFASNNISGTFTGKMAVSLSAGTYQVLHTIENGKFTLAIP